MSRQEQQERKNKRIGIFTSVGVHAALLLLFLFAMAWRAPDPPLPEFGIVINVGFDDQGSGDVQTDEPATEPETTTDEQQDEPQPETAEPVIEDKPVDKVEQEEVITSKVESPVAVEKKDEKVKEEPKKEPEKLKTEFTKEDAKKSEQTATNKGEKTESEGNDKDKPGNKGEPEGKLNPDAQYIGKPGGGGGGDGMSLNMGGWKWVEDPKIPTLPDNESGRIEFEIVCDANGDITGITTSHRGLSARAEQILREVIMQNSLERTASGTPPEQSKGKVIFILKTR